MAERRKMRNNKRDTERRDKRRLKAFKIAIDEGHITKKDIANSMDISISELISFFDKFPEQKKQYANKLSNIADIASDNLAQIVLDQDHPKNYDASKFVMNHYKNEMDEILEAKSMGEIKIEEGDGNAMGAVIVFGNASVEKKEETKDADLKVVKDNDLDKPNAV